MGGSRGAAEGQLNYRTIGGHVSELYASRQIHSRSAAHRSLEKFTRNRPGVKRIFSALPSQLDTYEADVVRKAAFGGETADFLEYFIK